VESPVTDKIALRSAPQAGKVLRDWGIDAVTLANNHMFDQGRKGFEDTREALLAEGIAFFGAGENLAEAGRGHVVAIHGLRVGLLACSWASAQTTCATNSSFGCAPLDESWLLPATTDLAKKVDALVVVPHWGYCDCAYPLPEHVDLAGRLLDAGATAVVGHHSHVIQGMVRSGNSLVAYSLGNFIWENIAHRGRMLRQTRDNREGLVITVRLGERRVVDYQAVPVLIDDDGVDMDPRPRRLRRLERRSRPLARASYPRYWRRVMCRRFARRLLYWINPFQWRHINRNTLDGAWLMLKSFFRKTPKSYCGEDRE